MVLAEEILKINPNHFFTLCYYGRSLYYLGRYEEALVVLNRCLEEEKEYYPLWSFRGDIHLQLNDYENAGKDYSRAFNIDLNNIWTNLIIGDRNNPKSKSKTNKQLWLFEDRFLRWESFLEGNFVCAYIEAYTDKMVFTKSFLEDLEFDYLSRCFKAPDAVNVDWILKPAQDNDNINLIIKNLCNILQRNSNLMVYKAVLLYSLNNKAEAIKLINNAKIIDPENPDLDFVYKKIHGIE